MTDQHTGNIRESVPEGFALEREGGGVFIIRYKRTGMVGMNIFLIIWLAGWTVACIFLLRGYLDGGVMEDGDPIPLWLVMVFWGPEIIGAILLTYILFCKKTFRIDEKNLVMDTELLGYHRRRAIPRHSIRRLVQVKDGGEDEDSFPSWGLEVEADKKVTLIFRQPYEKSFWLGQILAEWVNVEFANAPEK